MLIILKKHIKNHIKELFAAHHWIRITSLLFFIFTSFLFDISNCLNFHFRLPNTARTTKTSDLGCTLHIEMNRIGIGYGVFTNHVFEQFTLKS